MSESGKTPQNMDIKGLNHDHKCHSHANGNYYRGLLVLCLFHESINPFTKPRLHSSRHKWHFGGHMAMSVLLFSGFVPTSFFSDALPLKMVGCSLAKHCGWHQHWF